MKGRGICAILGHGLVTDLLLPFFDYSYKQVIGFDLFICC